MPETNSTLPGIVLLFKDFLPEGSSSRHHPSRTLILSPVTHTSTAARCLKTTSIPFFLLPFSPCKYDSLPRPCAVITHQLHHLHPSCSDTSSSHVACSFSCGKFSSSALPRTNWTLGRWMSRSSSARLRGRCVQPSCFLSLPPVWCGFAGAATLRCTTISTSTESRTSCRPLSLCSW
jgi:hypothetical protein